MPKKKLPSQLSAKFKKFVHSSLYIVNSEVGFAGQLIMVLLLVGGIGLGTYLVQQRTNLLPKAASEECSAVMKEFCTARAKNCQVLPNADAGGKLGDFCIYPDNITECTDQDKNECSGKGKLCQVLDDTSLGGKRRNWCVYPDNASECSQQSTDRCAEFDNNCKVITSNYTGKKQNLCIARSQELTECSEAANASCTKIGKVCKVVNYLRSAGEEKIDNCFYPEGVNKCTTAESADCERVGEDCQVLPNQALGGSLWNFCVHRSSSSVVSNSNTGTNNSGGSNNTGSGGQASVATNPTGGAKSSYSCKNPPDDPGITSKTPAGTKWFAFCDAAQYGAAVAAKTDWCTSNTDCPQNTFEAASGGQKLFDKTLSNWCYGFKEGARCVQLREVKAADNDAAFSTPLDLFNKASSSARGQSGISFGGISLGDTAAEIAKEHWVSVQKSLKYISNLIQKKLADVTKKVDPNTPDLNKAVIAAEKLIELYKKDIEECITKVNSSSDAGATEKCVEDLAKTNNELKTSYRYALYLKIIGGTGNICVKADLGEKPRLESRIIDYALNNPTATDSASTGKQGKQKINEPRRLFLCSTKDGKKLQWRVNSASGKTTRTDGELIKGGIKPAGRATEFLPGSEDPFPSFPLAGVTSIAEITKLTKDFDFDANKMPNKENVALAKKLIEELAK